MIAKIYKHKDGKFYDHPPFFNAVSCWIYEVDLAEFLYPDVRGGDLYSMSPKDCIWTFLVEESIYEDEAGIYVSWDDLNNKERKAYLDIISCQFCPEEEI